MLVQRPFLKMKRRKPGKASSRLGFTRKKNYLCDDVGCGEPAQTRKREESKGASTLCKKASLSY
jgi:hypothetical protein